MAKAEAGIGLAPTIFYNSIDKYPKTSYTLIYIG